MYLIRFFHKAKGDDTAFCIATVESPCIPTKNSLVYLSDDLLRKGRYFNEKSCDLLGKNLKVVNSVLCYGVRPGSYYAQGELEEVNVEVEASDVSF